VSTIATNRTPRVTTQLRGNVAVAAQVWDVLAPFVAAILASWLTYWFAMRQRRGEILLEQRLAAFNALQAALVGLVHYCEFKHRPGDDIGPSLPEGTPISALHNVQRLSHCVDANRIYISSPTRTALTKLCRSVSIAASMELAVLSDPSLEDRSLYGQMRKDADLCIERLHSELHLPGKATD
jgi:hypothetical protein